MKRLCVLLLLLFSAFPASASERILALAPHACEILYAIGAGQDIVGVVDYCDFPADAKSLPRVASFNRINVEAALALKPTMVIVMNELLGLDKLSALGIKVVRSYPLKVDEVLVDIQRLGKVTGHGKKAKILVKTLQNRLDKLTRKVAKPIPVFYEIWSNPILTVGKNTLINDVLQHIGFTNVFGAVTLDAPRVNVESVLAAKPQLVMIPSQQIDISERKSFWYKWLGEDVQVMRVNPDLLHRPGPRLLDGMEKLVQQVKMLNKKEMKH